MVIMTETTFRHVHNTSEEGDYGDDDDDDDDDNDDDMFEHDIDMFDQKVRKQTKVLDSTWHVSTNRDDSHCLVSEWCASRPRWSWEAGVDEDEDGGAASQDEWITTSAQSPGWCSTTQSSSALYWPLSSPAACSTSAVVLLVNSDELFSHTQCSKILVLLRIKISLLTEIECATPVWKLS